jgi:histidine triad (HIT) family protein
MATIFSRIIKGEIPSFKVYEDERVFAFLDIGPLSKGHVLVVPKEEAVTLDALSDESAAAIGRVLPRICRAVLKATGARAFNVLQNNGGIANQVVQHVHFHIIPKYEDGAGLRFEWRAGKLSPEEGKALGAAIAEAVNS